MWTAAQVLEEIVKYQTLFRKSALFVEMLIPMEQKCFKIIRQEKEKAHAAGSLDNRKTERTP